MKRKPTIWQVRWARWRKPAMLVMVVALVVALATSQWGPAAVLFAVLLGLGALGGGVPVDNGRTVPPEQRFGG